MGRYVTLHALLVGFFGFGAVQYLAQWWWSRAERVFLLFAFHCVLGASLSLFAPRGEDRQTAHAQDEFYIVASGNAELHVRDPDGTVRVLPARPGDALHVAAGIDHRFRAISGDFAAWVVFFPQESA